MRPNRLSPLLLLMTISSATTTAWANPLMLPTAGRTAAQAETYNNNNTASATTSTTTVITAPLTDWIKNTHTDLQWYTTISVGTPPQNFSVLIDTGSHALLLPQYNCTTCAPAQRKFDPGHSSTFAWSPRGAAAPGFGTAGDTIPLATVQGAECTWAFDDVSFLPTATSSNSSTRPVSFEFLLCYQEDDALTAMPGIDGILGLGVQGADPAALQWALLEAGVVASGVYGLYLPAGQVSGGELTLGGIDESKFAPGASLTWVPLNQTLSEEHSQWVMDMQTIYVDGEQLLIDASALDDAPSFSNTTTTVPYPQSIIQVLDSGTAAVMAPSYAVAQALYAQISPKIYQIDPVGTWGAPCADMDGIAADITFTIGTEGDQALNVTIPSSVFNLGPYNSSLETICQAVVNNWSDPLSYDGKGLWELGSPVLKNYYTAWDGSGLRVGFAPLGAPGGGSSGSSGSSSSSSSAGSGGNRSCH